MPGDYSRDTFDPRRNYTAVRLQQGRVSLDADWNEQVDITQHQLRRQLVDLVGREGAPARAGGFGLAARNSLVFDGSGPAVAGPSIDLAVPGTRAFALAVTVGPKPAGEVVALASPEGSQVALTVADDKVTARRAQATCTSEALDWSRAHALAVRYDGEALILDVDGCEAARVADDTGLHDDLAVIIEVSDRRVDIDVEQMGWLLRLGETLTGRVLLAQLSVADAHGALVDVGHWALDDGWGDRAADASLCGHDLRLGDGARWGLDALVVTAGRYYVDGVVCENDRDRALHDQLVAPDVETPTAPGLYLAYLEVWERTVSAQEDPTLRDVALGGADTAVRTQAVAQVRTVLLDAEPDPDRSDAAEAHPAWTALRQRVEPGGRMRARRQEDLITEPLANQLYRVEIHHGGDPSDAASPTWPRVPVAPSDAGLAVDPVPADWVQGRWLAVEHDGTTTVVAVTAVTDGGVTTAPVPKAATTARSVASLKWMTDNATQVFPVASADGAQVLLRTPVGHRGTELVVGDAVELSTRASDLHDAPQPLRRVTAVSEDGYRLTLDRPLPEGTDLTNAAVPLLRRWRQPNQGADTVPVTSDWMPLEHGVQVQFDGPVAAGHAWLVPTRTSTRQVQWPGGPEAPVFEPAREGTHRLARLALLWVGDGVQVDDLRPLFPPLGEPLADDDTDDDESVVVVPDRLVVAGDAEIEGTLTARRLRGRLGDASVDTPQLADRAVTGDKLALAAVGLRHLAGDVGVVPDGYAIFGPSVRPPRGYRYTHQQVELVNDDPAWRDRLALAGTTGGRVALAVLDDRAYALLQSGELWCLAPEAAGWEQVGALPHPRRDVALAAVDDRLHCVGGADARGLPVADHDVFHPATGAFVAGPPLEVARSDLGLVAVDRVLYAVGGMRGWPGWRVRDALVGVFGAALFRAHWSTRVVEALTPGAQNWVRCPSMRHGRAGMGIAALHSRIHVVGGRRKGVIGRPHPVGDHEGFVPSHGRWSERMPLPEPRSELGLAALQGVLYAVGGQSRAGVIEDMERYDLVTDTWHPSAPLSVERRHHGAAAWLGEILVVGGWSDQGALSSATSCTVLNTLFVHQKLGLAPKPAPKPGTAPKTRPDAAAPVHAPEVPDDLKDAAASAAQAAARSTVTGLSAPEAKHAAAKSAEAAVEGEVAKLATKLDLKPPKLPKLPKSKLPKRLAIAAAAALAAVGIGTQRTTIGALLDSVGITLPGFPAPGPGPVIPPVPEDLPAACQNLPDSEPSVWVGDILPDRAPGIDVSHYQRAVPWRSLRQAGVVFAYAKASDGAKSKNDDATFATNWSMMKNCQLLRGAYHFYEHGDDPSDQAAEFLRVLAGDPGDLPPAVDIEKGYKSSKKNCSEVLPGLVTFVEAVEKALKVAPMVYSSQYFWDETLDCDSTQSAAIAKLGAYPLWAAQWDNREPLLFGAWTEWTFWQFTNQGSESGRPTDLDRYSGNQAALEKFSKKWKKGP